MQFWQQLFASLKQWIGNSVNDKGATGWASNTWPIAFKNNCYIAIVSPTSKIGGSYVGMINKTTVAADSADGTYTGKYYILGIGV